MFLNKVAIVTGASRGIGASSAVALSRNGASVILIGRVEDTLQQVKNSLCTKHGQRHTIIARCITDYGKIKVDIDRKLSSYDDPPSVLINCAGISHDKLLLRDNPTAIRNVFDTNVTGIANTCKIVSSHMIRKRVSGSIINIGSVIGGAIGSSGQSVYGASKAALGGFTRCLAVEYGSRNIRVNLVEPGWIDTDMTRQTLSEINSTHSGTTNSISSSTVHDKLLEIIPLSRIGKVEDVANLILFLSGTESSYITGQTIRVDGGLSINKN